MIKIIDVDELFSDYISDYVYANVGKVKPEEIENQMPVLYAEFGKKPLKQLDGKTPENYYRDYSAKELLACLKAHLDDGVSVSDYLCEAITEADDATDAIIGALYDESNEQFTMYLLNMLSDKDCKKALKRLIEFIVLDYDESIRELATEILYPYADDVKEDLLSQINEVDLTRRACFTEILSHASKDDRVFNLLLDEFLKNQNNIPLYAGYLAKYGDERALPYLLSAIEGEKINYHDFEELRFAIEVLGGEYTKTRDFSSDKAYAKIKQNGRA